MYSILDEKTPKGKSRTDPDERPRVVKGPADLQRLRLEKLMKNPEKPVIIPERPKGKNMPSAPDFVRNVMGSSAGAGSGEFHVYRHLRRKEYSRQKFIQEKGEKEILDDTYHKKLEDNKKVAEDKTAKKRAKRLKKKQVSKNKGKKPKMEKTANESEEDNSSENESDDEEKSKKDLENSNNDEIDVRKTNDDASDVIKTNNHAGEVIKINDCASEVVKPYDDASEVVKPYDDASEVVKNSTIEKEKCDTE